MRNRMIKLGVAIAAFAALAVGGSALASAQSKSSGPRPASARQLSTQTDAPEVADAVQQPDSAEADNGAGGESANEVADAVQQPDSAEADNGAGGENGN